MIICYSGFFSLISAVCLYQGSPFGNQTEQARDPRAVSASLLCDNHQQQVLILCQQKHRISSCVCNLTLQAYPRMFCLGLSAYLQSAFKAPSRHQLCTA